jgi:hypothetical protein
MFRNRSALRGVLGPGARIVEAALVAMVDEER